MAPPPKARAALDTMKNIGFASKEADRVLQKLLKVYDNNWEYIEENNYQVLIDEILEEQELKVACVEKFVVGDDPEPSIKRLRKPSEMNPSPSEQLYQDACVEKFVVGDDPKPCIKRLRKPSEKNSSPSMLCEQGPSEASLKKPKLDIDIYFESPRGGRASNPVSTRVNNNGKTSAPSFGDNTMGIMPPQPSLAEETTGNATPPTNHNVKTSGVISSKPSPSCERPEHDLHLIERRETRASARAWKMRDERENPGSHLICNSEKLPAGESSRNFYEESKIESETVVITSPRFKEDGSQHSPKFEVPISTIFPPHHSNLAGNIAMNAEKTKGKQTSSQITLGNGRTSELVTLQEVHSDNIDIVSSDKGEVKLKFFFDTDRPHLRIPTIDVIFKMVEERCLKSYKNLQPDFSIMKVMKEMCQCALELSTEQSMVDGVPCSSNGYANGHCVSEEGHGHKKNGKIDKRKVCRGKLESNSHSLEVMPQPQIAVGDERPPHDPNDITRSEERVRISLVNDFSNEKIPTFFHYIPRNTVSQNAYVNFSLARIGDEDCCSDCFGDCVAATIPCACARETGGEFAYTLDGLVKKAFLDECISMNREPQKHHHFYCKVCPIERSKNEAMTDSCKGHLVKKFIKECWIKCGCNMQCGNRVVQRGITCNLQVFYTPEGKGWGLRTLDELPRGAFICEYVGEILTNMELYDRTMESMGKAKHTYPVLLDADWGSEGVLKDEEALCLDATFYGNVARFVNHRCVDSNMVEIPVEVETPDHHYYHLAFFTTRKVEAYEELTWDYGIDFGDDGHPIKAFKCRCGSKFCRDVKRSRTRSKALALR